MVEPFWTCRYCKEPGKYFKYLMSLHRHIVEKHSEVMSG